MSDRAGRLQLLAAAALFSTGGAVIKATELGGWQIASFRSGVAAIALMLLIPAARRGWRWKMVPVSFAYAATLILFVLANRMTTAANAIFLQSAAPLYVLLLGPLLLREPIRRQDLGFMAVVAGGMALFFLGTEAPVATAPDPGRGNVLAVASGVCWALTVVGLRWLGRGSERSAPPIGTVAIGNVIAFLACLPMALPTPAVVVTDWLLIGYLGVFQIGLAYVFLTLAIRRISALEVTILILVEPALSPIWAWLVHREQPSGWAVVGGMLILGATLVRSLRAGPPTAPASSVPPTPLRPGSGGNLGGPGSYE